MKFGKRGLAWLLALMCLFFAGFNALAEDELTHDEEDENELVLPEYRVNITTEELMPAEGLDENWVNILLLGTDTKSQALNEGRTDAIIVLSVHRETGQVKLSSVNRDIWVDIYQVASPNRINSAHAFGGPLLAIRTVNEVLGLNITQYISINFYGFEAVVDALGGVEIPLTKAECVYINKKLRYEPQLVYAGGENVFLNGAQALWYTRIRELAGGTVARTERQRFMLMTLANNVLRDADVMTVLNVFSSLLPYVSTNLSLTDVMKLLQIIMSGDELNFKSVYLPLKGSYHYDDSNGVSKVIFNAERIREDCFDFIFGEDE